MSRISNEELHDYLDGELEGEARHAFEQRLEDDDDARTRLNAFTELRAALEALPVEGRAPTRIWSALEERIGQDPSHTESSHQAPGSVTETRRTAGEDADIVPIGTGRPSRGNDQRGLRALWSQHRRSLVAAAVVLLTAVGSFWLGRQAGGVEDSSVRVAEAAPDAAGTSAEERAVHLTGEVVRSFETATTELEMVLREGSDVLEPETLRTLEESLATIDEAILDARRALERDPGSVVVERRLVRVMQLKLDVLKQAVTAVQRAA